MSQNQIDSAKENINFLTRTMLAYIAGAYLLAGTVGNHLVVWFEKGEFDTLSIIAAVCLGALVAEVVRLQRKIRRIIRQIGGTP